MDKEKFVRQFVDWFEPPPLDRELAEKLKKAALEAWNRETRS